MKKRLSIYCWMILTKTECGDKDVSKEASKISSDKLRTQTSHIDFSYAPCYENKPRSQELEP